jgi:two-component system nitrate/nitrite response regulator NarL
MVTRVLVVDDHAGFRSFAHQLLSASGFVVVGEVGNGADAIAASEWLRPDAVLLDVQLPDLDGFEVARRLAQQPDAPDVVLTSARSLSDFGVERLDGAGVRGFVAKSDLSGPALTAVLSA